MHNLIPLLALVSGMCGLAYELIYARLLTTYLGDMFHVGAAILASFLVGIALGSFLAHRLFRYLWLIELSIGVYAASVAFCFSTFSVQIQQSWLPVTSGNPSALIGLVCAVLITPALLVGFSVPIFSIFKHGYAPAHKQRRAFGVVYGFYNAGAAACVLLVEFLVLRAIGIVGSLYLVSCMNLVAGLVLLRIPPPPLTETPVDAVGPEGTQLRLALAALFVVSVMSGVYYMFIYKLTETLFGPFHENFALVLSLAMVGIATGTVIADRRPRPFSRWLVGGAIWLAASFIAVGPMIHIWASLNGTLGVLGWPSTALKALVLAAIVGIPFSVFGGTVPCLLREFRWRRSSAGITLGVSGLGNAAGYLIMVLWLYASFSDRIIASAICVLVLGAGLMLSRARGELRGAWVSGSAVLAVFFAWPTTLLHFGYDDYLSSNSLRKAKRLYTDYTVHRKFDSQLTLLRDETDSEVLIINGYKSLVSSAGGHTNLRELAYGITPALYSAKREHALVLGVGTGITAGATASVYEHTTAVEINPSVVELLAHFRRHNLALHENPNVDIVLDDGLNALLHGATLYDAILNTVTTPLYFASSKLYTRDFFRMVSHRLAPGGVYAMWFDTRVTQRGAAIIFQTLKEVFSNCHMTFLTKDYTQFLCANSPLRARDPSAIEWSEELRELFDAWGLGVEIPDVLSALVFSEHKLFETDWNAPVNTFDRPVLEFLMASRALSIAKGTKFSPYSMVGVNYKSSPLRDVPLSGDDLGLRLYIMRIFGGMKLNLWASHLRGRSNRDVLVGCVDRMLAYRLNGENVLTTKERLVLTELLLASDETERAWQLVGDYVPPLNRKGYFAILRARILLARGEPLDDDALGELYAFGPVDPGTRRILAQAAAARGDQEAATRHLEFLRQLMPPSRRSATLEREILRARESQHGGGS